MPLGSYASDAGGCVPPPTPTAAQALVAVTCAEAAPKRSVAAWIVPVRAPAKFVDDVK